MDQRPHRDAPAGRDLSRRSLLTGGAAAGLALLAAPTVAAASMARARPVSGAPGAAEPGARARNLILMVADGMAAGTLSLADQHLLRTTGRPSAWRRLAGTTGTRRALACVDSADSLVTDSAAASSAWSVGLKHDNGRLCVAPDGSRPEPMFRRAARSGKRTGAVTTTTITHATPAGFYANWPDRNQERPIAAQLVESPVEVALGGGAKFFADDLLARGRAAGLAVVRTGAELAALQAGAGAGAGGAGGRVLGLFNPSHLSHAVERLASEPSLLDMARFALDRLSTPAGGSDGFVLQIEGGRVDHAAHRNDAVALLHEQLEFDRTLAFVAEWVMARNDTLLIVTTDHATGNPGLCSYGRRGREQLDLLGRGAHSFEWALAELDRRLPPTPARPGGPPAGNTPARVALLAELLAAASGAKVDDEARDALARALAGKPVEMFAQRSKITSVMGVIAGNSLGVGFLSEDHTGDHVELMAMGAGSETLPGFVDNTELHGWMCRSLALAR